MPRSMVMPRSITNLNQKYKTESDEQLHLIRHEPRELQSIPQLEFNVMLSKRVKKEEEMGGRP
jgi:hypothetical protein